MNLFKSKAEDVLLIDDDEDLFDAAPAEGARSDRERAFIPADGDFDPSAAEDADEAHRKKGRKQRSKRYGHVAEDTEEQPEEAEETEWESPVKPSVSLPSRSVVERSLRANASKRMRKVLVIVGTGLAAAALTCVGLNLYSLGQFNAEKVKGEALQQQVDALRPLAEYYDGYTARRGAVSDVLKTDIQYSMVQTGIFEAAKKTGVSVKSETVAPGQPCVSLDPFVRSDGLGCITAQIQSGNAASLAAFAEALNTTPGLSGAYLNGINASGATTTATANVNYTGQTVSERYKKFGAAGGDSSAAGTTNTGGK